MEKTPLSDEEIRQVSRYWNDNPLSYLRGALTSRKFLPTFSLLKDHRVLEIGPGANPVNTYFPCGDYESASGIYPDDGLSLLRKQADASAVVVSFGVIDDTILKFRQYLAPRPELLDQYVEEVVTQIRRVMNPFSIIYSLDARHYMGDPDTPTIGEGEAWIKYGGLYLRK